MPFYRKKKSVGDRDHLDQLPLLRHGANAWNAWRAERPELRDVGLAGAKLRGVDLAGANLRGANLREADLFRANLSGADLFRADLTEADLRCASLEAANLELAQCRRAHLFEADLRAANLSGASFNGAMLRAAKLAGATLAQASFYEADLERAELAGADLSRVSLSRANLSGACLAGARLIGAYLDGANLFRTDLRDADLSGAQLTSSSLIETDLTGADLTGCRVYGISAWNLRVERARQDRLIITPGDEAIITVDNIAIAQFIYLLLNNAAVRHIIDTMASKVVLILGRFTEPRKAVLDAMRDELKRRDYAPVVFDFQKPTSRDLTETIVTLAGMARFVIADLTDAKSVPQELMAIAPHFPSVPIVPIILRSQTEYAMFEHFRRYPWVLEVRPYGEGEDPGELVREAVAAGEGGRGARPD